MRKLFVAGCSVSDYTEVDEVYGELISKILGYIYVHEGSGCGSNWRIWRRITNHIINGSLTPNDLLIIQYTTLERREFWSFNEKNDVNCKIIMRDKYPNGGNLIKFKTGISHIQDFPNEKKMFELYENNFINPLYEMDVFQTQHLMFQCLLKEYKIPTIFFGFYHNQETIRLIDYFKDSYFHVDEVKGDLNYLLKDMGHFNKNGHEYVAKKMAEFIKSKNL